MSAACSRETRAVGGEAEGVALVYAGWLQQGYGICAGRRCLLYAHKRAL
jgi:hypothetical protein